MLLIRIYDHISARLSSGPPAGLPVSSRGGGSIGFPPKLTAFDQAGVVVLLDQSLVNSDAQAGAIS